MRNCGTFPTGVMDQRWSWPICGTLLLTGSALVWLIIAQALAHWLG